MGVGNLARARLGAPVRRIGVPRAFSRDLYHFVLEQRWSVFYLILVGLYLLANCGFATLYWLQPGGVDGSDGSWANSFFFSIETIATVGYGVMHPVSLYAHMLVVIEIIFGVLAVPMATGLTIVKFALPTARVLFSTRMTFAPYDGVPNLSFRVASGRSKGIIEAQMKMTLLRRVQTREGLTIRRLIDLKLARSNNPIFALSWTLLHPVDADSPLYGMTPEDWLTDDLVIICVLTGIDETASTTVHARFNYYAEDIAVGYRFADIISSDPDGSVVLDLRHFDDIAPIEADEMAQPAEVATASETVTVQD